jgi:hypothetical protein
MDTTEIIFALSIAMVYPFFFNKLTNKVVKNADLNTFTACEGIPRHINQPSQQRRLDNSFYGGFNMDYTPEYKKCQKETQKKIDEAQLHKHLMLIALALIGIVLSSVIQTKSTKLGVGLGGILTLITALFMYWHKYNETGRLAILGSSLLFLMYFSVRLYKIDSIANILSFEFGTK